MKNTFLKMITAAELARHADSGEYIQSVHQMWQAGEIELFADERKIEAITPVADKDFSIRYTDGETIMYPHKMFIIVTSHAVEQSQNTSLNQEISLATLPPAEQIAYLKDLLHRLAEQVEQGMDTEALIDHVRQLLNEG